MEYMARKDKLTSKIDIKNNFRCGILQSELKLEIQCKEEPSKEKYVKKKKTPKTTR